jgi:hypothetical protein
MLSVSWMTQVEESSCGAGFHAFIPGFIVLASQRPFLVVLWYAGHTTLTWYRETGEDYGIHKIANYRRHR